jgi:flagellar biogenesis protein FliO
MSTNNLIPTIPISNIPIDNLFKCTFKTCMIYSFVVGLITIIVLFILNIYVFRKLLTNAKKRYNITESFNFCQK